MAADGSVSMVGLGEGGPVLPACLMKAEVSWMSTTRGSLSYEERILKRVQGILNKLTVNNYKLMRDQLIESGITTPYILMGITHLIFYRALNEPKFCPLYAFLCSELLVNNSLPSFPSDVPGDKEITFNRILLNNCQEVFEREHMNATEIKQQVMTGTGRRRSLRDIRFICELLKERHHLPGFLSGIFEELLDQNDFEVHVEAVCLLLNTFGKKLDEISDKSRALNDRCFDQLKDMVTTHPQLETRLKFMILDLLDVRANNWVESECKVKRRSILELIRYAEANTNTRYHSAGRFYPMNRPHPRRW